MFSGLDGVSEHDLPSTSYKKNNKKKRDQKNCLLMRHEIVRNLWWFNISPFFFVF